MRSPRRTSAVDRVRSDLMLADRLRPDLNDTDRLRRRQLAEETEIDIHSYDWLTREAQVRVRESPRPYLASRRQWRDRVQRRCHTRVLASAGMPTPRSLRRPPPVTRARAGMPDQRQRPERLLAMRPPPGEIGAGLALLGLLAFVVCYSYERSFYATFTVSPDDVGQGYAVILGKAATGVALLAALTAPTLLAPWLLHHLRSRHAARGQVRSRRDNLIAAGLATGVTAGYSGLLAALAGLSVLSGVGTGLLSGLFGAVLRPRRPARRRHDSDRAAVTVVGGSVVFLLIVVAASHAGTGDSRRLLRLNRATQSASAWQTLLAMNTPAATIRWTPSGGGAVQTTVGRVIGSVDGMLLVYDLQSCTLRRLSGDVSAATRLTGSALGPDPDGGRGSPLPHCPRAV
jgi:hypothetical protein